MTRSTGRSSQFARSPSAARAAEISHRTGVSGGCDAGARVRHVEAATLFSMNVCAMSRWVSYSDKNADQHFVCAARHSRGRGSADCDAGGPWGGACRRLFLRRTDDCRDTRACPGDREPLVTRRCCSRGQRRWTCARNRGLGRRAFVGSVGGSAARRSSARRHCASSRAARKEVPALRHAFARAAFFLMSALPTDRVRELLAIRTEQMRAVRSESGRALPSRCFMVASALRLSGSQRTLRALPTRSRWAGCAMGVRGLRAQPVPPMLGR